MMSERKILHLDLDAFFCAVEELRRPEIRGKAFAVGGKPNERGVVSSCSYAARRFGVHSAMPMSQALRACPDLTVIPGDHGAYGAASERVMSLLRDLTPLVEQVSIDEAFLDVSDLPEPAEVIARQLQALIAQKTELPCSIGVAGNKLMAKIANDVGKAAHSGITPPQAITVVPPGGAEAFLINLPVRMLWGVGKKTELRLQGIGIQTIGELARSSPAVLQQVFGKNGADMARHARGIDDAPVVVERDVKSISQEVTFDRDVSDPVKLKETLRVQAAQVAFRLRKNEICGSTIRIKLRWSDFTTLTRQVTMEEPVDQDGVIYSAVEELFNGVWKAGNKVRLIGVGASGLVARPKQLSLWDTSSEKERRLLEAVDELREKFGAKAILPGRTVKPDGSRNVNHKRKVDHS
jgi:DNA polymerase IV